MQMQRGFIGVGLLVAIVLGVIVLGGGTYFVMQQNSPSPTLSESESPTLPSTNTNSQNTNQQSGTANTTGGPPAKPTTQTLTGAVVVQSHDNQGNQKEASVILIDTQTGAKKELAQITNAQSGTLIPKVLVDQGALYYLGGHIEMMRRDLATGVVKPIPPSNLYEASKIKDFAVSGNTMVVLEIGSVWEDRNPPSSSCSLWLVDLALAIKADETGLTLSEIQELRLKLANSATVILNIPVCEQAH